MYEKCTYIVFCFKRVFYISKCVIPKVRTLSGYSYMMNNLYNDTSGRKMEVSLGYSTLVDLLI